MIGPVIEIEGKRFVLVEEVILRRLERMASKSRFSGESPPLPKADKGGNRPALEFLRVSIARDIIRERKALGLTQEQLAKLAGLRQETLSRIESGKHSPVVRTVAKIERALKRAQAKASR